MLPCTKVLNPLSDQEPLDFPEEAKQKASKLTLLHMIALGSLVIGVLFYVNHWPYGMLLLELGLSIYAIWNVLELIRSGKKRRWEWSYSVGRLLLLAALYTGLVMLHPVSVWLFGGAAFFFVLGIVFSLRSGSEEQP